MTKPPLCRHCGRPIAKRSTVNWIKYVDQPALSAGEYWRNITVEPGHEPKSKADCERLVNQPVLSVSWSFNRKFISKFTTWDGESYVDEFFCNGTHAQRFARLMAKAGHCTVSYNDAAKRQQAEVQRAT